MFDDPDPHVGPVTRRASLGHHDVDAQSGAATASTTAKDCATCPNAAKCPVFASCGSGLPGIEEA